MKTDCIHTSRRTCQSANQIIVIDVTSHLLPVLRKATAFTVAIQPSLIGKLNGIRMVDLQTIVLAEGESMRNGKLIVS